MASTPTGIRVSGASRDQVEFLRSRQDALRDQVVIQEWIDAFEATSVTKFDRAGRLVGADGRPPSAETRLDLAEAVQERKGRDLDGPLPPRMIASTSGTIASCRSEL